MIRGILRTVSLVLSVIGAGVGVISGVVDNKRNELYIDEKIDKKFEERYKKEEEETDDEEEES